MFYIQVNLHLTLQLAAMPKRIIILKLKAKYNIIND